MKTIAIVTVARSDFGIYKSLLNEIVSSSDFNLNLIVTGMHLEEKYGMTINEIMNSGFEITHKVKMNYLDDTPHGVAEAIASGVSGFSKLFKNYKPDYLMLLGDRFEMLSAAVAAIPFNIPIIHLHGGETTEGQIDEVIRHSLTKMSHIHFASTEIYKKRIAQLGEEEWRVFYSGAPSLDELATMSYQSRDELEKQLQVDFSLPTVIATFHPETLNFENTEFQATQFLEALAELNLQTIITFPNADTSGSVIINLINDYAKRFKHFRVVPNLGKVRYFSILKLSSIMIGNSSSGIIEAASFKLPVINIGDRQRGRVAGRNVIHVAHDKSEILKAAKVALENKSNGSLDEISNPYFKSNAAKSILDGIRTTFNRKNLIIKKFEDLN